MSLALSSDVKYENATSVSLKFLVSSGIGLFLVALVGSAMGLQLLAPGHDLSPLFNRIRPIHIQLIIFAWLSMALMGAMLYAVPRIVGRDLYSRTVGNLHFILMWVGIGLVGVSLLAGYSEGREYLEPIFIIDVAVVLVWLLFAFNIFMTIFTSKTTEYPYSLKFITVSILYLGVNYLIGMVPLSGMQDILAIWTFAHNEVNGWFMFGLMGLMYWMLPKLTQQEGRLPYNLNLTRIHFWSVMIFIPPSVLHHLLYREIPVNNFWKEMGQWTSVGMLLPTFIWTYIVFKYLTSNRQSLSTPLKFFAAAIVFYFLNCVQGATQSIRYINDLTHGTQWTIGHAHLALVGWISFGAFGVVYYLVPLLAKRRLHSESLANTHLWLSIIGFLTMWISLSIAGVIQGLMIDGGVSFFEIKDAIAPYLTVRLIGGVIFTIASLAFAYNVWATLSAPKVAEAEAEETALAAASASR